MEIMVCSILVASFLVFSVLLCKGLRVNTSMAASRDVKLVLIKVDLLIHNLFQKNAYWAECDANETGYFARRICELIELEHYNKWQLYWNQQHFIRSRKARRLNIWTEFKFNKPVLCIIKRYLINLCLISSWLSG